MVRILCLNGSIRGGAGNTAALLNVFCAALGVEAAVDHVELASYTHPAAELAARLRRADGLVVGTGVYWSGHGSPLQRFFEVMSAYENSDVFAGKPVVACLTMDSVGGAEVASRLLGTFNQLGCLVPPNACLVVSRLALLAGRAGGDDVWRAKDAAVLAHNLLLAARQPPAAWHRWEVELSAASTGPWPGVGPLPVDAAPWDGALWRTEE